MIRIVLELEPGGEALEGRCVSESGEPEAFFGWIELAALLDRILVPDAPHGEDHSR